MKKRQFIALPYAVDVGWPDIRACLPKIGIFPVDRGSFGTVLLGQEICH